MGVMRSLSFCYLHYMVTIFIDSCRFFVFLCLVLWNMFIYICMCMLSPPRVCTCHFSEIEKKKTYMDDFGDFEIEFQVGFLIFFWRIFHFRVFGFGGLRPSLHIFLSPK